MFRGLAYEINCSERFISRFVPHPTQEFAAMEIAIIVVILLFIVLAALIPASDSNKFLR
jgi:hypothetical protein